MRSAFSECFDAGLFSFVEQFSLRRVILKRRRKCPDVAADALFSKRRPHSAGWERATLFHRGVRKVSCASAFDNQIFLLPFLPSFPDTQRHCQLGRSRSGIGVRRRVLQLTINPTEFIRISNP